MTNTIAEPSLDALVLTTPLVKVEVRIEGEARSLYLKLEGAHPGRSVKDRTALSLLSDLEERGLLQPGAVLLESTSGNLGLAVSRLAQERGYGFVAVVDPKTSPEVVARMQRNGARLEMVEEPDGSGGFLAARRRRVRGLMHTGAGYVWTNQYANAANPAAHERWTAPEIDAQMDGRVDAVFAAVSTCGTALGLARWFRQHRPATEVFAVDARGSVIFGGEPGPRALTGIGSNVAPQFDIRSAVAGCTVVDDADAFTWCHALADRTGIRVGGSSGAVLHAAARTLAERPDIGRAVCLCADSGDNYRSTIYSPRWLHERGVALGRAPEIELADDLPA